MSLLMKLESLLTSDTWDSACCYSIVPSNAIAKIKSHLNFNFSNNKSMKIPWTLHVVISLTLNLLAYARMRLVAVDFCNRKHIIIA